jgi:hypothetical protein
MKIAEITAYRDRHGVSLKEAKEAIEAGYTADNPKPSWDDASKRNPPPPSEGGFGAMLDEYITRRIGAAVSKDTVRELIKEALEGVVFPTRVEIVNDKKEVVKDVGMVHFRFPLLLEAAQARMHDGHHVNLWVVGPAGTGKTTSVKQLGKALDRPVTVLSISENKYDVLGFTDANGNVVSTAFLDAYVRPSTICIDEVDAWFPGAALALQAATANGFVSTPSGMLERHPDCIIICCANTFGYGQTFDYCGRMKQDAAFLDRFAFLSWPIDPAIEMANCVNKAWCKRVQGVRERVKAQGYKGVLITPRATFIGDALLARETISWDDVEEMTLRKGMTDEQWNAVK